MAKKELIKVTLPGDYWIEIDSMNYMLMHKYTYEGKKAKKMLEAVDTIGYYGTIQSAISQGYLPCIQTELLGGQEMDIKEYAKQLGVINEEYVNKIADCLKDFKPV